MADTWSGVIGRLGEPTGDGRIISPAGISNRDLPLPLSWQRMSNDGHLSSVVVGRIDSINVDYEHGEVHATGALLDEATTPEVAEVRSMLANGVVRPSMDAGAVDYEILDEYSGLVMFTRYEIAGATLVSVPAFANVSIALMPDEDEDEPLPMPVYAVTDEGEASMAVVSAACSSCANCEGGALAAEQDCASGACRESMTACATALPPAAWFEDDGIDGPLTITPDGRVFGLLAPWNECHIGLPGCVTVPPSNANYAYFTTGSTMTAEGHDVPVGHLTVGTGHASPDAGFRAAAEHYDHTGTVVAVVAAGENAHGIWVAGAIVPEATPEQVEALRRSPLSGDWRRIGGNLELVAALAVNVPGFPVPRARVSVTAAGEQLSLVASARFDEQPEEQQVVDPQRAEVHLNVSEESVINTVRASAQRRARARLKLEGK